MSADEDLVLSMMAIRTLEDQLTAAQSRVAGYVDHIKQLEAEVAELRAITFTRFNNEECWIYQGDGDDHLESLVCPVVVSPQKMIELESAQSRVAELERQVAQMRTALKAVRMFGSSGDTGDGVSVSFLVQQAIKRELGQ